MTARLDLKEVADRAGVSLELAQAMADQGVFQRSVDDLDAGSVRRAMLLSVCIDAGIPLETIGQAMRDGYVSLAVLDRQYYGRWGEHLDMTWADLAEQQGIPFDVLQQMCASIGFAPPAPDEHPRTDEPDLIAAGGVILRTGVEPQILLRMLRVYAENFRRITRSETGLWHDLVDVPAQRAGASQRELLDQGAEFGDAIMSVVDGSTMAIYRRMQEHAWMGDLVEHLEVVGETQPLGLPPAHVGMHIGAVIERDAMCSAGRSTSRRGCQARRGPARCS